MQQRGAGNDPTSTQGEGGATLGVQRQVDRPVENPQGNVPLVS